VAAALEERGHRHEPAVHRVRGDPEPIEGEHAKERLRAGLTEDGDGRLGAFVEPHLNPPDPIGHLASIRQHERPFLLGPNAQAVEEVCRQPGVGRHRVDECLDGVETGPFQFRDLDTDSKRSHLRALL
jgi:hypothetical protein